MAIRNEQDLLEKLTASSPSHTSMPGPASPAPSCDVAKAKTACVDLEVAFERDDAAGRRRAGWAAYRVWKTLPIAAQDEFVHLTSGMWAHHFLNGRPDRALRLARRLKHRGEQTSRTSLQAEALFAEGACQLTGGDVRGAIQSLDLSRALFSSTGKNQADVVRASLPLAAALRMDGDRRSGAAVLLRARVLCLEIENAALLAGVSMNLGNILLEDGDHDGAVKHFGYVVRSSELLGFAKRAIRGQICLALASLRQGGFEKAIDLALRAHQDAKELSLSREQCTSQEFLAIGYVRQGELQEGLRRFRLTLQAARRGATAPDLLIELHRHLAEFWIAQHNPRRSEYHLARSLKHAQRGSEAEDTLALNRIKAEILWLEGKGREALASLVEHAKNAADLDYGYEHLLTARRIAMVAADINDRPLAKEWWARTEFLAESCGAQPLLERWRADWDRIDWGDLEPTLEDGAESPAMEDLALFDEELPPVDLPRYGIITRSRKLEEQASWIARLAPTKVPILIRGHSGTGKELYAQLAHMLSPRVEHPFLAINCGALPSEIIESELFGHRRGSFTGAVTDKQGLFQEAHRGTLFLDEIGEMPGSAQAKLLRVLETGEFRAVGGLRYETVDVRIVAATNVDLEQAVHEGRFRKDLYYRLKGLEVVLPALRERLADIPPLAHHFFRLATTAQQKELELPFETIQWLMGQPWPGNVRELKLAVERAVAMAPKTGAVMPRHFVGITSTDEISSLPEELEEIERARVENALEANGWNTAAAARLLGMSRTTLGGRMKKLGIRKPRQN